MDFQQKYLTEKLEDASPPQPNASKKEPSLYEGQVTKDQYLKLVDSESPVQNSYEDFSKYGGSDPRRPISQRNSQFNHGQYDAKNKTINVQQNKKHMQMTNDSSNNSLKNNTAVQSHNSKAPNSRSIFNKTTLSAQNSIKSTNQVPQQAKTDPSNNLTRKTFNATSNRIFQRAKESIDKHVTIDLYQAVYGDDSSTGNTAPAFNQSDVQLEQSKSMQNIQSQYGVTMGASSNQSKPTSPTRKRNSQVPGHNTQALQQQINNIRIPSSKYAKSSVNKTRNTKVKANTIIAQVQQMGESSTSTNQGQNRSPMRIQGALFQKVLTHRSRQQKAEDLKNPMTLSRKNAEARNNQAKLFESSSGGRLYKQLSPTNSNPSASLQAQQLGPNNKMINNRKNMKSHETLNNKRRTAKDIIINDILKPTEPTANKKPVASTKQSQGITPKSSMVRKTETSYSNQNSKSPMRSIKQDKASFSNSNMSGKTKHEQNLMKKFQNNKGTTQQSLKQQQHHFQNSRTSPNTKMGNTAFSSNLSVTRCQPSQKKTSQMKTNSQRARIDPENMLEGQCISVENEWQSKIRQSHPDVQAMENNVEIQDVHIQEVDDASDFNPLNRTNNQENERMMKMSALKVVPKNQFSQTVLLPSPGVIQTSEQKSQITLFSPHGTNSNVSPLPERTVQNTSGHQTSQMANIPQSQVKQPSGSLVVPMNRPSFSNPQHMQHSQAYTVVQRDLDSNYAIINFNNYITSNNGDQQQPMYTEGDKTEYTQANKFSMLIGEDRNQTVKSAMQILSQTQNISAQNIGHVFAESQYVDEVQQQNGGTNSLSEEKNALDKHFELQNNNINKNTRTVMITNDGEIIESHPPANHKLTPQQKNQLLTLPKSNSTGQFKGAGGKHAANLSSVYPAAASIIAIESSNRDKVDDSSNSLVVIDNPDEQASPVPKKKINENKKVIGAFGVQNQPLADESADGQPVTLGPNSSTIPKNTSQVSHEGGGAFGSNSSNTAGPQLRLTPSPKLSSLPRRDRITRSSEKKPDGTSSQNNANTMKNWMPNLNQQAKVYDDVEFYKQGSTDQNSGQIVQTGHFDDGLGTTLKKTPNVMDAMIDKNVNKYKNNAILIPELNLSPRSEEDDNEEVRKSTQRMLFDNIQAQYVSNNSGAGLNNSKIHNKSVSTKQEDKLMQPNQVPSHSQSIQTSQQQYNSAVKNRRQQQQFLKKSSLLAKSLVEDASEDFSNIEEHISTFYNQGTLDQTGQQKSSQAAGGTKDEDAKVYQTSSSKDKDNHQIIDKFKNILPGDVVSRTQALRSQEVYQSTNFGSTLENLKQFDENDNNLYLKNTPLSGASKNQGLLGATSQQKLKNRKVISNNKHSINKNKLSLQQIQKVNHNAQNINQNYGMQAPKTLFGKAIDNVNTQHLQIRHRHSDVSKQYGYQANLTSQYDQSKDPTNTNQYSGHRYGDDIDMRDSCREVGACGSNPSILCGYQSAINCGQVSSSFTENGNDYQVQIDLNKPYTQQQSFKQKPESRDLSYADSSNDPYQQNVVRSKGPGIKDLVTSVDLNQPMNPLVGQANPQTNSQMSPTIASPQTISSSPMTKGSGSAYSPGVEEEMPTTYKNQIQTPSNFDSGEQSEAVKDLSEPPTVQQAKQPEQETPKSKAQPQQQNQESQSDLHKNHLIQTMQSLHYMKVASCPDLKTIQEKGVVLPPTQHKKTLIFDLDETLVHCVDDIDNLPFDLPITVQFAKGERIEAGINVRPYVYDCLKQAKKSYQVVIFTASHQSYADAVLDTLEEEFKKEIYLTEEERIMINQYPENERAKVLRDIKRDQQLIDYRMYREHCYKTPENVFIKDLRIIKNRDLSQVIIVDNAVYSFGFQLSNGIPIIPFYDSHTTNLNDEELVHLVYYFNCIVESEDVRVQNRRAFQLEELKMMDIAQQLRIIQNGSGVKEEDSTIKVDDYENESYNQEGRNELGAQQPNNGQISQHQPQQFQVYRQNVNELGQKRGDSSKPGTNYEHNGTIPEQEDEDEDEDSELNQNNNVQRERRKKAQQQVLSTVNSSQGSSVKAKIQHRSPM